MELYTFDMIWLKLNQVKLNSIKLKWNVIELKHIEFFIFELNCLVLNWNKLIRFEKFNWMQLSQIYIKQQKEIKHRIKSN